MKKILITLVLGLIISSADAQIQSLAGPRLGLVYISASPGSTFLNGDLSLENLYDGSADYGDLAKGAFTSLYGWQWESRFADGGNVTGVVEWIALVGGLEKGKFLPSVSSMVGARTASGIEFAVGPNLSLGGIAMVFGVGYNYKSGNLNIPINFAFIPGRKGTFSNEEESYIDTDYGPDGIYGTSDDVDVLIINEQAYKIAYNTGNRFSITVGFNLNK